MVARLAHDGKLILGGVETPAGLTEVVVADPDFKGAYRRVTWRVLPLLFMSQVVMVVVRLLAGAEFPGWWMFFGSFVGALLWIPLHYVLLLPQYQPVVRDANRPI